MRTWTDNLAGRFLVIDGPDGAGKSTQLGLLAEWLRGQGVNVVETRDPGGTVIGDKIRAILLDHASERMSIGCETLLYMASRTQLKDEVIAPALAAGRCVLSDRWVSSTVAYQVAGGNSEQSVMQAYRAVLDGFAPDLTIILDIPAETGLARVRDSRPQDRMESKPPAFHRRVREIFRRQASEDPARFALVDAAGDAEQVQQELRAVLRERFGGRGT